ncbi:MAG: hypothetical protein KC546_16345 [Anaerolineae bacterium]|nr:hypothetical protein [Anaerolineae bacterium]MCA9892507.1 hypothetical protein [Anaerolineae bacterium]MCB9461925.1 hypothetical protein [Anaerolineaceae bacterium]
MEELLGQIGNALRPESLGDWFVYLLLIMNFLVLVITPEKNDRANYMIVVVLFACVVDLMRGSNGSVIPVDGFDDLGFGTMMTHVIMGIVPFLAAGAIRITGRKGRMSVPLAVLAGVFGVVYAVFAFVAPNVVY